MRIRIGRIAISSVLTEFLVILSLLLTIGVVALSGDDFASIEVMLRNLGRIVGPLAAFLFCLLGGWWVARKSYGDQVVNGAALGAAVLVLHVWFLFYLEAPFHPALLVFVIANPGGGALGGWIAARRAAHRGQNLDRAAARA